MAEIKVVTKMVNGVERRIHLPPEGLKLQDLEWVKKVQQFTTEAEAAKGLDRLGLVARALYWSQTHNYHSFNTETLESDARKYAESIGPDLFEDLENEAKALEIVWDDFFEMVPANPKKKLPNYLAGVFQWAARVSDEIPASLRRKVIETLPRCLKPELWESEDVWWMVADAACRLMRDRLEEAKPVHDAYMKLDEWEVRRRIRSDAGWYAKHCLGEDWLKDYGTKTKASKFKGGPSEGSSSDEMPTVEGQDIVGIKKFRWRGA